MKDNLQLMVVREGTSPTRTLRGDLGERDSSGGNMDQTSTWKVQMEAEINAQALHMPENQASEKVISWGSVKA